MYYSWWKNHMIKYEIYVTRILGGEDFSIMIILQKSKWWKIQLRSKHRIDLRNNALFI